MKIFKHPIPASLDNVVHSIWMVEDEVTRQSTQNVQAFPHGFVYINVNASKSFIIQHNRIEQCTETKCYLCGQITRSSILKIPNVYRSLVIRFHPWVVPALFGYSAADIADRYIDMKQIDKELHDQLEELIEGDFSLREIGDRVETIIVKRMQFSNLDKRLAYLAHRMIKTRGAVEIKSLADELTISTRRVQQLFRDQVGITPKKFGRIVRLQSFMYDVLTGANQFSLYDHYFDQPHFSREVKTLTGLTPAVLKSHLSHFYARQAYLQTNLYYSPDA